MTKKAYADNGFKGLGIIKCDACGGKLRDHPIRPCQTLNTDTILVARPSRRGDRQGESTDAAYQRRKRQ